MNREALRKIVKKLRQKHSYLAGDAAWYDEVADMIEAALSPEEQPWQPKVGETVEVIETGECGKVTDAPMPFQLRGFDVELTTRLRPASIAPGDFVLVDGTKTGMVVAGGSSVVRLVIYGSGEAPEFVAESRMTLLLKGRN